MDNNKIWMRDLPLYLKKVYKSVGQNFPLTPGLALIDLVEWLMRVPSKSPRTLYKSEELRNKILTPFELKGLAQIEKLILSGGDLKPYLGDMTRTIRNRYSKKNDFFASDWGLLHFHIGTDFENKGIRVSRTRRVLLARFQDGNAYLIDIVNHGWSHEDVWGEVKHLEIIHRNWPHILGEAVRISEDKKTPITSPDYIKLRNAGLNVPILIDNKIFFAPGLGVASDGSSTEAVRISLKIERELDFAESEFRKAEPNAAAFLVINDDFSVGFLEPKCHGYYRAFEYSENNQVTRFFYRLFTEIHIKKSKKFKGYILPKNQ
ncbi:MAG: hypothetical protein ACXWT4_14645 [Methylobacter sp.]